MSLFLTLWLTLRAEATWSIVVVDTDTGEVAVGAATCLVDLDIRDAVPVIVPGVGAGASQALVDADGSLRNALRTGLLEGRTPADVLSALAASPGLAERQVGLVSLAHPAATRTGTSPLVGAWRGGLTGETGSLRYALQGNVLAGEAVLAEAEQALRRPAPWLDVRLLRAMEAARAAGGDGRCSCPGPDPTACGAPPADFVKSAHTAAMVIARVGDPLGPCTASGCAQGSAHLALSVAGGPGGTDPVAQLDEAVKAWRASRIGRPDALESRIRVLRPELPADGRATTLVEVTLRDRDGGPVTKGEVVVTPLLPGALTGTLEVGAVEAKASGVFSFEIVAGTRPAEVPLTVRVADGLVDVQLHPPVVVVLGAPDTAAESGRPDAPDTDEAPTEGVTGGPEVVPVQCGCAQARAVAVVPWLGVAWLRRRKQPQGT